MSSNSWIRGPCTVDFKSFQNLSFLGPESSSDKPRDTLSLDDREVIENWKKRGSVNMPPTCTATDLSDQISCNQTSRIIKLGDHGHDTGSLDTMQLMKLVDRLETEEDIAVHNTRFYTERYRKIKRRLCETEKMIREEEQRENLKKSFLPFNGIKELVEQNRNETKVESTSVDFEKSKDDENEVQLSIDIYSTDKINQQVIIENRSHCSHSIDSVGEMKGGIENDKEKEQEYNSSIVLNDGNRIAPTNGKYLPSNRLQESILMPHTIAPANPSTFERTKRNIGKLLARWKDRKGVGEVLSESD